jgi:molybdopterin-guanine dinucleotide biosynthesis protein B
MVVFGLAGWSGSGKTTLVTKLIPALVRHGLTVSTLKHAHHGFEVDTPGKDSYEHRAAGATEVMVASARRWALMRDLHGEPEPTVADLMARMAPVDLEVHRPARGKPLLCHNDPRIVAVASDQPLPELSLPQLDLNDAEAIAAFIIAHCGLEAAAIGTA